MAYDAIRMFFLDSMPSNAPWPTWIGSTRHEEGRSSASYTRAIVSQLTRDTGPRLHSDRPPTERFDSIRIQESPAR